MPSPRNLLSKRWPWLIAAGLVVLVYAAQFIEISMKAPPPERPVGGLADLEALAERDDTNVLFILTDTLRSDRLSTYGYGRHTAPLFDELAESGAVFSRNIAQSSWTKCSMASLWTGLYPMASGVTRFEDVLADSAELPAEILKKNGFVTTGLYRNGWVEGYFGFGQGFDVYTRPVSRPPADSIRRANPTVKEVGSDGDVVLAAKEFLRIHGKDRWFLYLHLMDIHEYLYDEDSAVFGSDYSSVYDNSILRTNLVLGELYWYLESEGHLNNTLIVITADHGEAFGERGIEGHARWVYRETTEVPLIISFPFKLPGGVTVDHLTRNVDIWPTILDLLGIEGMDQADGVSQRPALLAAVAGEEMDQADDVFALAHLDRNWGRKGAPIENAVSLVGNGYRYVRLEKVDGEVVEELFDLKQDPAELQNVLAEESERAKRLRGRVEEYLERTPPWSMPDDLEMDEMQLDQLRALGYAIP
jgi:arylsulfatase A-like enzyme